MEYTKTKSTEFERGVSQMSVFDSLTGKLAPQSTLIKRYLILRLAGRGGMSAIYQALDVGQKNRPVAIKEMSQENLDDEERSEALARFQQEAQLLSKLRHRNLPQIYDYFNSGGRSFLVMDYIDGKTLLQLLQEAEKPLSVYQVIDYADQLCDVLAYLHQQNPPIIFRDLKPTNVMVTRDGHVYLIDFGIARLFKEGQSQDTTVLGSPGYAPPEQHGSGQTNPRSDLYALGATLHCCLTNRDPYHSTDRFVFPPVRQFNSLVPPELDYLIMRLLAVDEDQRPIDAHEVKRSLRSIRQQIQQRRDSVAMPVVALAPTSSVAPTTQYIPPPVQPAQPQAAYQATQLALEPHEPQAPLVLRANPVPSPAQINSAYPSYPIRPPSRPASGKEVRLSTHVWTPSFIIVFLLLLVITIGTSIVTFNINQPYASNPNAGLDHATQAGLALLVIVVSFIMIAMARSVLATITLLLSIASTFVTFFAFLLQTLRDIQPSDHLLSQLGPSEINQLLTYGLLTAGMLSLLWLFRSAFTWDDRLLLLIFFSAVCLCMYLQSAYPDNDLTKEVLLLVALITFIQGILVAGQMERKRKRF
jgi:serine/threonine protein kinase